MAVAVPATAQWRAAPEVRLSGGEESNLIIDPGVNRAVVPGGSFAEITPAIALRWSGTTTRVEMGTLATFQQFFNDDRRWLYAQSLWGDVYRDVGRHFRARVSVLGDYFDDSERGTVQRYGGGANAGLALIRPRGSIELWTGASGHEYPDLTAPDGETTSTTYAEGTWSGGGTVRVSPAGRFLARGEALVQVTDSRDPDYDSRSWTGSASVDTRLVSSAFLTISGTVQQRHFTSRPDAADDDAYWQLGAGLRYLVAPGWTASIRYGYSMYTWPEGYDEDTYRVAVALQYTWEKPHAPPILHVDSSALVRESTGSVQRPGDAGTVRLRVHAPDAHSVAVAGDFNQWNPGSTPLHRVENGWWEVELRLAAGTYEYVYVIDGNWTTPPEAGVTREDGFGGRNGVLEVLPPDA